MVKKVSVLGTVGIPACYGGFESLVENLTKYSSDDISYTVYCSSKSYKNKEKDYNNSSLIYLPFDANGIQSIPYDILSMVGSLFRGPDVTLILGVSGCVFLPFYRLLSKSKIITNIDGLEWKRDKWGKFARKFLKFSEALAVKYSDVVISDNQAIADYVRSEYNVNSRVIAYGGDHVMTNKNTGVVPQDYYFGLCRIEPENNVEMILYAFSKTDKKLKFIGNWDKSQFGIRLKDKYSKYSNIDIIDPVYDLSTLFDYRANCFAYIHGHSAGGTNPSLVEAMHFSKPIFAYDCNFNRYSTENKCSYFKSPQELIKLLYSDSDLYINAQNMKSIANRRYTWEIIAKEYESLY
ncbi:DUF1972 domain-containing protein [Photobacterium aphoticum]|uniref:Glycosyl transferase n=1 Tax=Photobacterium aphoticum TaxID=754436 RepID=A0A0J1JB95_9GAMM|nr:DUF1972 domain-containing protein [Photobacterium aphoticum]KLU98871.1 glycosyl transferase [Photobacterium aphoticum]PSU56688.1 glycosyltransferase family 1 protein [Photobacterium aphoticum]GHA38898.1 rhamnosyltransferase [Photobacterium aphoticum]